MELLLLVKMLQNKWSNKKKSINKIKLKSNYFRQVLTNSRLKQIIVNKIKIADHESVTGNMKIYLQDYFPPRQ